MIFLKLLYAIYWLALGAVIWRSEKKIAWLEEENRHLKEVIKIGKNTSKTVEKYSSKV